MNDEIDRVVYETREFLAARPAPDVRASVMSRIVDVDTPASSRRHGVFARFGGMLWTPREVSIRPAFALATAAIVATLLMAPYVWAPAEGQAPSGLADPEVFVQFRFETAAMRVQLAGSFTNWEPRYELRQSAPGIWTVTIPLTHGVHDYAFVVDGRQWVPDPYAPQIGDGFGGTNSRLALLSPDTPQL